MISIGIYQDSPQQKKRIRQYCGQFLADKGIEFQFLDFTSEERLLAYQKNRIHLLFLDTRYRNSMDGIALMHRLEKHENISHIVYLSDCIDRLIESFGEKTIGFCLRPLNYDLVPCGCPIC